MIKKFVQRIFIFFFPELGILKNSNFDFNRIKNQISENSTISKKSRIFSSYYINNCEIEDYTYISQNSNITNTRIGKFCSIGPNFICGSGMHPTNGISTSPVFYSRENNSLGFTLCDKTKFIEQENISIGNDVFIGANVVILNGVTIGNGAVIGAGSIVSKDIPPYAIAVGVPIQIIKYRFDQAVIGNLLKIKWWEKDINELKVLEEHFYNIEKIIEILKPDK